MTSQSGQQPEKRLFRVGSYNDINVQYTYNIICGLDVLIQNIILTRATYS